jgi:hypothetical protein
MDAAEFPQDLWSWTKQQMIGVDQKNESAVAFKLSTVCPLTVAWVPTGMKIGVLTSP